MCGFEGRGRLESGSGVWSLVFLLGFELGTEAVAGGRTEAVSGDFICLSPPRGVKVYIRRTVDGVD